MPRDGTETYILPFPDVVEDTTIESTVYNGFTNDVAQDLNTPRPIKFGGTGAVDAATARFNLATEIAAQVVTNYDSHLWVPGSFYSATTATGEPVDGHAFSGVAYIGEALANPPTNQNVTLEARDRNDTTVPGRLYVREKKAGVWSAWTTTSSVTIGDASGIISPTADMFAGLKGTAPTSYFTVNSKADLTGTDIVKANKDLSLIINSVAQPITATGGVITINGSVSYTVNTPVDKIHIATNKNLTFSDSAGIPTLAGVTDAGAATVWNITGSNIGMLGAVSFNTSPTAPTPASSDSSTNMATTAFVALFPLRNYISGFTLTWNSTTSVTVQPGSAANSLNTVMMSTSNSVTKSTASWVVGAAGGLDTGVFAANKTYHWFAIRNPTTGLVDFLFSLSPTAPTMPSGYTQFRRIASGLTDTGTATWRKFVQDGDYFILDTPVTQTFTNPGTAAFAMVLTGIPTGVRLEARLFLGVLANAAADQSISWYATQVGLADSVSNIAGTATTAAYASGFAGSLSIGAINFIMTDTAATARCRLQVSAAATNFYYSTHGWRDNRGKDG